MLSIAIIEDEAAAQEQLRGFLDRYAKQANLVFEIKTYPNAIMFLDNYQSVFDLVFMDIEMPHMNGLEAAAKLRALDKNVVLIFVTNLARYAIRGYEVDALDYILKPLEYDSFSLKIRRAVARCLSNVSTKIVIASKQGDVCLRSKDILYVEISRHDITYHTENGKFSCYGTMKEVERQLSPSMFSRCNSCYLVNLGAVKSIDGLNVMVGQDNLLISHPRKKSFMKAVHDYFQP